MGPDRPGEGSQKAGFSGLQYDSGSLHCSVRREWMNGFPSEGGGLAHHGV
jgi:hypothetical protein